MTKRERELTTEVERLHAIIAWMREHGAHVPAIVEWEVRNGALCMMVCTSGLDEKAVAVAAVECLKTVGFGNADEPTEGGAS